MAERPGAERPHLELSDVVSRRVHRVHRPDLGQIFPEILMHDDAQRVLAADSVVHIHAVLHDGGGARIGGYERLVGAASCGVLGAALRDARWQSNRGGCGRPSGAIQAERAVLRAARAQTDVGRLGNIDRDADLREVRDPAAPARTRECWPPTG